MMFQILKHSIRNAMQFKLCDKLTHRCRCLHSLLPNCNSPVFPVRSRRFLHTFIGYGNYKLDEEYRKRRTRNQKRKKNVDKFNNSEKTFE